MYQIHTDVLKTAELPTWPGCKRKRRNVVCPQCGWNHSYYSLPDWECKYCKYRFINFNLLNTIKYRLEFYFTGTIPI